ncbi:hypothetical protein [Vibrio parahaemolyticus]|uniref:hypothetical protein n=1 Tax=Vibrio parahaemolyticus TaxID=670 RepID=UPI0006C4F79E|nr:hypothetical protein ACX10_15475 [Vibrio parahaemolyticus]
MSNKPLLRSDLETKYIVVNKQGEYKIYDNQSDCPVNQDSIVTPINRHTRARTSSVEMLAKILAETEGYKEIVTDLPQEHFGLCLDYLFFKHPEVFETTEPAKQEAFWNTQRMRRKTIVESVEAYYHHAN